jgi:hypothetical protein
LSRSSVPNAARRELADNLRAAARSEQPFEYPETASELAAASYPLRKMTATQRTPRPLGVDAQTLSHWRSRGLLRSRVLRSDQLRPGRENAAPLVGIDAAPVLVCASEDLLAVRARPLD